MITADPDHVPATLGTVAEEARRVLGIDVSQDRAARFQGPGWSYERAITRACPEGHRQLHLFRRPYTTAAGKPATYTACVCSQCRTAFTMPDVGVRRYRALIEQETKPAAGNFEVYSDEAGKFRFRLKAGNGEVVASGEAYESRAAAEKGCEAVQRAADGASINHLQP